MPKVRGTALTLEKPWLRDYSRELRAAETCRPTLAGTSRRCCAWRPDGRPPAARSGNTRQYSERMPGIAGWPNSRIARRPPGAAPAQSQPARAPAPRRSGCRMRSSPRRRCALRQRNARRIAADEANRATEAERRHLARGQPQHGAGEVDADDRCAGHAPDCRHRQIGGPRAEIQYARARRQFQRVDGAIAPPAVEPGAEHAVQEVVARRDRIEHPGDAGRGLVGSRRHPFHAG